MIHILNYFVCILNIVILSAFHEARSTFETGGNHFSQLQSSLGIREWATTVPLREISLNVYKLLVISP